MTDEVSLAKINQAPAAGPASPRATPAEAIQLAGAAARLGQHDEADQILCNVIERFPDHLALTVAHGWSAQTLGNWPEAVRRWRAAYARFPENRQVHAGLGQALRGAGHPVELQEFVAALQAQLATAETARQDPARLLDLEFEIARLQSDWPSLRRCAEQIIARDAAPAAGVYLALSQAAWHLGDLAAVEAPARQALAGNPRLSEAALLLARVATERGDGEAALSWYGTLAALQPETPQWPLKQLQLLSWLGRVDEARRAAAELLRRWPNVLMVQVFLRGFGLAPASLARNTSAGREHRAYDPNSAELGGLRALLDHAPVVPPLARAAIEADPERDVIIAEPEHSNTALLIFAGTNDGVAMPLPVFDRFLVPLDVTPIYLRDFHRLRYLSGIRSIGGYQASIAWLRRLLRERGFKRLCTFGNCVGGFAAIRYGIELGADRILAFHTPTYCPAGARTSAEQGHNFMLRRLLAEVPSEMTDLKPFLAARQCNARIDLLYDALDAQDRDHAERLGHIPGVHLQPLSGLPPGQGGIDLLRRFILSQPDFSRWLAGKLDVAAT